MSRKLIHTYQLCDNVSRLFGFSDFIKGTTVLYKMAKKLNVELYVDYSKHPIAMFLDNKNFYKGESNSKIFGFNENNFYLKKQNREDVYSMQSFLRESLVCMKSFPQESFLKQLFYTNKCEVVRVLCNSWNREEFDQELKDYIKASFMPNKKFTEYLNKQKEPLGKEYNTLHIRVGDCQYDNELPARTVYPMIEDFLKTQDLTKPLFLTSDNRYIKKMIKDNFNVYTLDNKPIHMGDISSLPNKEQALNRTKDTLCDMYILFGSKLITVFSKYGKIETLEGSGFSEIAHTIFDVPVDLRRTLVW